MDRNDTRMAEAGSGANAQFGLRDVLSILIRRKWIVASIALPIIFFATLGTLRTTDAVTATTEILIEGRSPVTPSFRPSSVDWDVLLSTATEVAGSMPVAAKAAAALWDTLPSLMAGDPAFIMPGSVRELRNVLLSSVDTNPVGEANILRISVTHPSGRFAMAAVGAMTEAYINYSVESQQNTHAIEYYTEQIRDLQLEIDSLMSDKARVMENGGFESESAGSPSGQSHIKSLEYSYFTVRSEREGLQQEILAVEKAVASSPDYIPTVRNNEFPSLTNIKREYDDAVAQLSKLRLQYQPESEWILRQQEYIEDQREQLYMARDNYILQMRVKLEQKQRAETSLGQAIHEQRGYLEAFPDTQRRIESLDLQIATQRNLLESLQFKRGEVRLQAEGDLRISNITQLNEPTLQFRVTGGKKLIYLIMAIVLALAAGLVAAVFVEKQDHKIYDRRDAEQALQMPVLGTLSPDDSVRPRP